MTLRRARVDRTDFPSGMVWLVGAGPGDPELLTRKAERLIREATAIYYDALVGPGVLELAPASARLVHVGKRSGRHSKDQKTIDRLIVEAALTGERVVRLKGGDPSIFGRATEELEACRTAGVPVAVCPGVTAARAAAAGLGRSLTLRGLARKLVLVTAHARDEERTEATSGRVRQIRRQDAASCPEANRQRRQCQRAFCSKQRAAALCRFAPMRVRDGAIAGHEVCWP